MEIENKNSFIKIDDSLIRITKIDSVKMRHIVKANNFGKISDESYPEIIVSVGADKYVFPFATEAAQKDAFKQIEKIVTT